jgi:AcrR family transcriptional regulator
MSRATPARTEATRRRLRDVARRLFATRGIAAVGLREVAQAAGQRNTAAAHYHFGTKDELLADLLIEGAVMLDEERCRLLDAAEEKGPVALSDIVAALVLPSLHLRTEPGQSETWFRFLANVMGEKRDLFEATIVGRHANGYDRCVAHLRSLFAAIPAHEVDRRIVFAMLSLQALFAAREAALDAAGDAPHPFWSRADVTAGLSASAAAILDNGPAITD